MRVSISSLPDALHAKLTAPSGRAVALCRRVDISKLWPSRQEIRCLTAHLKSEALDQRQKFEKQQKVHRLQEDEDRQIAQAVHKSMASMSEMNDRFL